MVYLTRCHSPLNLAFADESPLACSQTVESMTLHIGLLGRFRACADERPIVELEQRRLQTLLAYILLHSPAQIPRQQIAFALWPESTDEQAQTNLRTLLHRLRAALPGSDPCLQFDRHHVWWRQSGAYRLDVADFDAALVAATAAEKAGDLPTACQAFEQAVALYEGDLLPVCYDDWINPMRERLNQAAIRATERLTLLLEEAQDYAAAVTYAQRLIRTDPLHEAAYRHLMRLHALSGNRTGIVRVFNTCEAVLRHELGVTPDAETQAAYRAALQQAAVAVPPHLPTQAAGAGRGNLPPELTSLVGRERDLAQARQLLTAHRLVTLTGSAGVGKTRLALRIVSELRSEFPDGAWWVDLGPVADEALVTPTIAAAVGVREGAGHSTTQALSEWLADRRLLLVLDNCEQLASRVGTLAQMLLEAAPHIHILVTSQRSLDVTGEVAWRVPSLAVPSATPAALAVPGESDDSPATLEQMAVGSVRLFVERAQASLPSFALTAGNAAAVAQICRRLNGIPLAIELAAARIRTVSIDQIVARLDNVFALLTRQGTLGGAAEPTRQQTLWAAMEWSHGLLAHQERLLFRRLAVFAGSFTLEAVEAVGAGHGIPLAQVLGLMAGLEDKSLVEAEPLHGSRRFQMHEVLQQYAATKLAEAGESARLRAEHFDHYARLTLAAGPHLASERQAEWLDQLEAEHDNLRAALAYSQAERACAEIGLQTIGGLTRFWATRGHFKEGRHWARALLAASDSSVITQGRLAALRAAANLANYQADYAEARAFYEQALEASQALGDQQATATIVRGLGTVAHGQGDCATALRCYGESLALCRELGDRQGEATALANLGLAAWQHGDTTAGRAHLEQCLAQRQQLRDEVGIAYVLHLLADIAWSEGRAVEAQSLNEESLKMRRRLGDRWGLAYSLDSLAVIAWRQGDRARARALFAESLLLFHELGSQNGLADTLDHLAGMLADEGSHNPAAQLMAAADALRAMIQAGIPPNVRDEHEQQLARIRTQLGDERFRAAGLLGRALTIERTVQLALAMTAL